MSSEFTRKRGEGGREEFGSKVKRKGGKVDGEFNYILSPVFPEREGFEKKTLLGIC